jgi:hypothetical protein
MRGHGPERALAARQHQDLAQGQQRLAARQCGQCPCHDVEALRHGQQAAYLGLVDDQDLHAASGAAS